MPAVDILLLHRDFDRLDAAVDEATHTISGLLAELVRASRARIAAVQALENLRRERQILLDEELSAQSRARDLLDEARKEMAMQEAWAREIRQLFMRAEMDGVDISTASVEQLDAGTTRRTSRKGQETETRTAEEVEREDRAEVFGRQLLYLTHSTQKSESRVRAILYSLQSSRTNRSSRIALNQLHALTRRYSARLEDLALDRERLTAEVRAKEKKRNGLEEKRDEAVLDMVLEWDESRSAEAVPASAPAVPKHLTEEQLNEIHQQWVRMQATHQQQAEGLLGKLVAENDGLKARLAVVERELKDVKAGRREDEELLKKATKEIDRLSGGNSALAVSILDFELDLFAPEVFHQQDSGRYAAELLHRKMRKSLQSLPPDEQARHWQFLSIIFWTRNPEFVQALTASGLISSIADLDDFINSFNRAHPLFLFIVITLATVYTRNPVCHRLILGRWAFDLPLAETICPSKGADKVVFPPKIVFVEPYTGFYLLPQLRKREPQIVEMEGVLRRFPLGVGGGLGGRPVWQQNPPLCLDFYLSPTRCTDERCSFSHSYKIPRQVLDALRFELARTPCPLAIGGLDCLDPSKCFFAHTCPRGDSCPRRGCAFKAPGMHVYYVPSAPAPVQHFQQQAPATIPSGAMAAAVPEQDGPAFASAPHPPSTRSALERLLSRGVTSPRQADALPASLRKPISPSKAANSLSPKKPSALQYALPSSSQPQRPRKHSLAPASPFDHPLSLADAAEAAAAAAAAGQPAPSRTENNGDASIQHLTDEELASMLEKARVEEEEYAKGLQEDPFFPAAAGEAGVGSGRARESSLFGALAGGGPAAGAKPGHGRAPWEAALSGRKEEGVV
ncbi:hypothetical protein JCM11251_000189 [Rhodosporidiobolus azoricus]